MNNLQEAILERPEAYRWLSTNAKKQIDVLKLLKKAPMLIDYVPPEMFTSINVYKLFKYMADNKHLKLYDFHDSWPFIVPDYVVSKFTISTYVHAINVDSDFLFRGKAHAKYLTEDFIIDFIKKGVPLKAIPKSKLTFKAKIAYAKYCFNNIELFN